MVYDFACKIKNVANKDALNDETLLKIVNEINDKHDVTLQFKFVLPNQDNASEFLVKSQASVSSMPHFHDKELDAALHAFISYLEEIAAAIEGEISRNEGFYNNSQTFKRLFN